MEGIQIKKNLKKYLKEYILLTIGCIFYGTAINYFFISNHLAEGGVTGICLILYYLFKLPVGTMYFVINIPLLILGWKMVGKDFLFKTIYGTICLSTVIHFTERFITPQKDVLTGAVYGGLLVGIGLGIIFSVNGSTGGTDIIGRILYNNFNIPMGTTMLALDVLILGIAIIFFGKEVVMYTLIAMFIASKVVDYLQDGIKKSKCITIISQKTENIKKRILSETERGATIIKGEGAYTGNELNILYCIVNKFEINKIKSIVREEDHLAFLTISDVSEVLGEGFSPLKIDKKQL